MCGVKIIEFDSIQEDREESEGKPLPKKEGSKNNWYWEEVPFIPKGIDYKDLLRFQGRIFIKSIVVEELKIKGEFKKKQESYKKRKRVRSKR